MTIVSLLTDNIGAARRQDWEDYKRKAWAPATTAETYGVYGLPVGKGPGRPITWKTAAPVVTYPMRSYYKAPRGGRITFARARTMGRKKNYPAQRPSIPLYRPRTEVKTLTYNTFVSGTTLTTGEIQSVTDVAQGTASEQREGNVIKLLDIKFNGTISLPSGTNASARCRLIVFKWKQGYVSPAVAGILSSATIDAPYNQLEARNYSIMYDRYYDLVPRSGIVGAYGADVKSVAFRRSCGMTQTFTNTSGNSADSGIWVIVITDVTSVVANLACQTRWIDV